MDLVPEECVTCEIVLGRKLRDRAFSDAVQEKSEKESKDFYHIVAVYMNAFHKRGHSE